MVWPGAQLSTATSLRDVLCSRRWYSLATLQSFELARSCLSLGF